VPARQEVYTEGVCQTDGVQGACALHRRHVTRRGAARSSRLIIKEHTACLLAGSAWQAIGGSCWGALPLSALLRRLLSWSLPLRPSAPASRMALAAPAAPAAGAASRPRGRFAISPRTTRSPRLTASVATVAPSRQCPSTVFRFDRSRHEHKPG